MNYKISKELFEAVCADKIFNYLNTSDRIIFEFGHNNHQTYMPINDFFFKCKKWAYNQGYIIFSSQQKTGWAVFIQTDSDGIIASFEGSEQQAVFDACQWILDNKDKQ